MNAELGIGSSAVGERDFHIRLLPQMPSFAFGKRCFGSLALLTVFVLQGCATYSTGFAKVERETSNRNVAGALKSLDELKLTKADQTLYHLNKGMLLRMQGDYIESNRQLDSAKSLMESLRAISLSEQASSLAVNDTLKAYEGDDNEQLLIYAFKELNYLQSGDIGEAAVEARQFDIKQRLIAEKNSTASSGAFVRYLNGLVYESAGERDSARIDYFKAVEGYKAENAGFGVPAALQADLDRLEHPHVSQVRDANNTSPMQNNGEVVFILHNGLGPSLGEAIVRVLNPNPTSGTTVLSLAVPRFVQRQVPVARVELSEGAQSASSELVEDVNYSARKSLDARLPTITARALARMLVKNAAVKETKKQSANAGMAGLLVGLASDVGAFASERADTRSWSLLPGNINMTRLSLPEGMHDLKATFYDANGNVLSSRNYNQVKVVSGKKAFVADYFLAAAPAATPADADVISANAIPAIQSR